MGAENTYGEFPEEMNLAEAERHSANGVDGVWKNMVFFLGNVLKNRNCLTDAFYEKKHEDYAICVHGMKSSLALLGAMELSAKAKELELAAKEGRYDFVEQNHAVFLMQYDNFVEKIEQCLEKRGNKKTVERRVPETAEKLIEAADDVDAVGLEELAKELAAAKDITPNQKSVVAQLLKAVEDLDFDAVKEVAEKIKE